MEHVCYWLGFAPKCVVYAWDSSFVFLSQTTMEKILICLERLAVKEE